MFPLPEINRFWSWDFSSQCWFVNVESDCAERHFIQMLVTYSAIHILPQKYTPWLWEHMSARFQVFLSWVDLDVNTTFWLFFFLRYLSWLSLSSKSHSSSTWVWYSWLSKDDSKWKRTNLYNKIQIQLKHHISIKLKPVVLIKDIISKFTYVRE